MSPQDDVAIRRAQPDDEAAVLDLLSASLGWVPDEQSAAFFRWKHQQNPFGASPAWVAALDGDVVGFRSFLRWQLDLDGTTVPAVRAVDTATHPDHQGRGIFRRLTMHALDELRDDGVGFVFNTPNERSRPGYLSMGWQLVGRLPVLLRPHSTTRLLRVARARTAATKWSTPTTAGVPALEALNDGDAVVALIERSHRPGVTTHRTADFLTWRYGFAPLHYRVFTTDRGLDDGCLVVRLRQRGPALELAICEELVPPGSRVLRDLLTRALRETGADHALRLGPRDHGGGLPVPGLGPTLVWRAVTWDQMPDPRNWSLALGDVELL